jgi:ATP-binding cassette subfamily B protein
MFKLIQRIFAISGRKKRNLIVANLCQLIQASCEGLVYLMIYHAITRLIDGTFDQDYLLFSSIGFFIIITLRYVFNYQVNRFQSSAGYEIMKDIRIEETSKLKKLPLGTFQRQGLGGLSSIFTTDITFVEMHCMYAIARYVAGMSIILMTTAVMFWVDWRLTLLAIAGFIPGFLVYRHSKKQLVLEGQFRNESQQSCIGAILEYLNGMETIRAYRMTDSIFHTIVNKLEVYKNKSGHYELNAIKPMIIYQSFIRSGMGLIFVGGVFLLLNGQITLNVFVFFAIISMVYYQPIEMIFHDYATLNIMGVALDRLDSLKHEIPLPEKGKNEVVSPSIKGRNLKFKYDRKDVMAIKGINIDIEPNTLNAIVGRSGSGKTTLLNLIARFYDRTGGSLLVGNHDIETIEYDQLLKNISFVFQDTYLLEDTILNNIKMGCVNATKDEVISAARKACCHEFISKMENGYETILGEGGSTLSGGEMQRIAIARAILKDVPFVLLDEALANIDPENSWEIKKAIATLTKNKTVLIVAHTLEYIRFADQILVMDEGEIVERGTHSELLERSGIYADMWSTQQESKHWKVVNG